MYIIGAVDMLFNSYIVGGVYGEEWLSILFKVSFTGVIAVKVQRSLLYY